jgi:hypothetical protein
LSLVVEASAQFHIAYDSWPRGFSEFYPDRNSNHIAFLPPDSWSTNDAWGHPLIYKPFDVAKGYGSVASLGRDAKPGGNGEDGDMEERFR